MQNYPPSVRLTPQKYDDWLSENPKTVIGGPIELEHDDNGLITFVSRKINTQVLPEHYAKKLYIYCKYNIFKGLKIRVTPEDFDYLLRADPTHENGKFFTEDGSEYRNWPHFHELDYYKPINDEIPGNRHVVTSGLYLGMPPNEFLDEFKFCYNIDDGSKSTVVKSIKGGRQRGLTEEYGRAE
jgi:hypothetical protein